jgi:hypothetical protein
MIADSSLSGATMDGAIMTIAISGDSAAPGAALLLSASAGSPVGISLPLDLFIGGVQQTWFSAFLPAVYIR